MATKYLRCFVLLAGSYLLYYKKVSRLEKKRNRDMVVVYLILNVILSKPKTHWPTFFCTQSKNLASHFHHSQTINSKQTLRITFCSSFLHSQFSESISKSCFVFAPPKFFTVVVVLSHSETPLIGNNPYFVFNFNFL